jgi:NitT/TauT family transport system permease protein
MRPGNRLRLLNRQSREAEVTGLDRLDLPIELARSRWSRWWEAIRPTLWAIAVVIALWQLVVFLKLVPAQALAAPLGVAQRLGSDLTGGGELPMAIAITIRRASLGLAMAIIAGVGLGLAVARFKRFRTGVGPIISGLEAMPSIAWFPLAILVFGPNETAILSVVVLGAAPVIAAGLISGVDDIPRVIRRAGRILGARGGAFYRHVVIPAALPSFVTGLKRGWAETWRTLIAGELLVTIVGQPSLGGSLAASGGGRDASGVIAILVAILVIGLVVEFGIFGTLETAVRRRSGLL